ncbi:uncharacterized protein LOC133039448 [Cannabis sativa]|uniref:uncharacterized protein LOC133039448 n=1 Tax=Cannabis sativa TaxID=3483 RepID=UPI0029C9D1BF|nr:uncharacterized protein LOC133039448 [Cannabis sativa]
MQDLGKKYGQCRGTRFPRMLNWSTPNTVTKHDVKQLDVATLFEKRRLEKVEAQQVAILTACIEMKADFKRTTFGVDTTIVAARQRIGPHTIGHGEPLRTVHPSPPTYDDDDDVYPEDWQPDACDVPSTPANAIVISLGDTESQDVEELQGPPDGVEFCRLRRKRKPVFLNDYTAGKKKQRQGPVVVDTLKPADARLLKFFQKWITYARDNGRPRDVHTGEATRSWFVKLMVLNEWLEDAQIDAMAHLLRRRRTLYPEVYTRKGVVLDTSAPQFFSMFWNMCEGDRARSNGMRAS